MALYNRIPYGGVTYGRLYKPSVDTTVQRISAREQGYVFDPVALGDFDILNSVYDASFFALPYSSHYVVADEVGRPDLISYREYRDTDFWSFILMYNGIADPISGIKSGSSLKVPVFSALASWLTRRLIQEKR